MLSIQSKPQTGSRFITDLLNDIGHTNSTNRNPRVVSQVKSDVFSASHQSNSNETFLKQTVSNLHFQGSAAAIGGAIAGSHNYLKRQQEKIQNQPPYCIPAYMPYTTFPPMTHFQSPLNPTPIRFGALDITWLAETATGGFVSKGIDYLLDSVKGKEDENSKRALAYLEQAHNATGHSSQTQYLEKAEAKFLNAALALNDSMKKAEAYKHLAIVSKMLNRPARVTNSYAEKSMEAFNDYRTFIELQRANVYGMAMNTSPFLLHQQLRLEQALIPYNNSDIPAVCNKLHTSKSYQHNPINLGGNGNDDLSCSIQ